MASDFWAGYVSGAVGIIIGNPLDLVKVRLQTGTLISPGGGPARSYFESASSLLRGTRQPRLWSC